MSPHLHIFTLLICALALSVLASGCARYGWANRPLEARDAGVTTEGDEPLRLLVETISAPADRSLDLQRATLTLTRGLERCGPVIAAWGELPGHDLRVRCVAIESDTRGFDQMLQARVALACDLIDDHNGALERIETFANRSVHASTPTERIERARLAESEALAAAAASASCPLYDTARDILAKRARDHGKKQPE